MMNLANYDFKFVDYSYPTSIHASRYGFYKDGCYTLIVAKHGDNKPTDIKAYKTEDEAIKAANRLSLPWWSVYIKQGRRTN